MSSGYLVSVKVEESTITLSFQNSLFEKNHCHFIKTNRDFMKTPYKPKSISQYDKFKAFF
jgi:hypothetical protein